MAKKKEENQQELLWYGYNLAEEKKFKDAVKAVQKICRGSLEYDLWQTRSKADSTYCPICNEFYTYVKAETHHYPQTMFDVCERILEKRVFDNTIDEYSGFALCQEIMNEHLLGNVNYVVLCKACHEKFHADHPEVITKVAEVFESIKEKKPLPIPLPKKGVDDKVETGPISETEDKVETVEESKPELVFPPKPEFIHTGSGIVIVKDGIEIDI